VRVIFLKWEWFWRLLQKYVANRRYKEDIQFTSHIQMRALVLELAYRFLQGHAPVSSVHDSSEEPQELQNYLMGVSSVNSVVLLALCLTAWWGAGVQATREDWRRADEAIVRLQPGAFRDLPAELRTELEHRGCTIPQPYNAGGRKKNVITGPFTSAGQTDWAVLCSHEKRSAILVFRGGHSGQVDSLAEEPDSQYLQAVAGGQKIGYSRLLAVAPVKVIRQHFPQGDHAGIQDTFMEKASVLWYRSGGKWKKVLQAE
jgi:hypothetical protein